jgi:structural maintenance of chromosome 2
MNSVDADGNVVPGGKCIDSRTFVLTSCAISIFMDLIIIPIPSIMVWNLQMYRRTKVLVVFVMSMGWVATGASVGRFIVYYYRFAPSNTDRTWNIGIAISIAEPAVHIMTACAPATKCLFRYLFPRYATDSDTSYYGDGAATAEQASRFRSRGSRALEKFNFGPLDEGEDIAMELGGAPRTLPLDMEGESVYDLKAIESFQSSNRTEDMAELASRRMSCSKTARTEASEPFEAEPKHCLGLAR